MEGTGLAQLGNRIQELLERIVEEEGFKDATFQVSPGAKKGDNYIGVVHRVKVEGQGREAMSLIVKCQPASAARREQFQSGVYFERETQYYNEVLPAFQEFQRERGVKEESYAPSSPKCYLASDLLILSDMCHVGYKLCDRLETLDRHHCAVVLKELARFHAVSFAFRDQKPAAFKALAENLPERFLVAQPDANTLAMLDVAFSKLVGVYDERVAVEGKQRYLEALERFTDGYYRKMVDLVDGKRAEPYAVIAHGDVWINNFLVRYGERSRRPERLCFLDFQLLRHASPATDIGYFLSCCTDKPMRDLHLQELLQEYYDTLCGYVTQLGSDPQELFPYDAFQNQMREFARFGLGLALIVVPLITTAASDAIDMDAACEDMTSFADKFNETHASNDVISWQRICDVVTDMVDAGYLE